MGHILVIDDEKNVRNMVRMTLEHVGHKVEVAEDGPAGLSAYGDGHGWDLVLVDQRMAGMPGLDVVRELRRRNPEQAIIMVTAYATAELAGDVVEAGAVDFLSKPFSAEMLRGAVAAAMDPTDETQHDPEEMLLSRLVAEADGSRPRFSYFLNGFKYWYVANRGAGKIPHGFDIYRTFEVRSPGRTTSLCIVGVAPHVRMQIHSIDQEEYRFEDPVWDLVCSTALANYLWENARTPPEFLAVYELTTSQLENVREMKGRAPALRY